MAWKNYTVNSPFLKGCYHLGMSFFSSIKRSIPLNSLEKFMLAHESEYVSYNSQIMVEFKGDVRLHDLRSAIDRAIAEIPLLRSHIEETLFRFKRFYKKESDLKSQDVVELRDEVLSQDAIDEFAGRKFNLSISPAFRFLIGKTTSGKNILIFNVHHT
ncbi:MAG: condensation domain-containing protein, partial [Bacteriovorax sp.]